MKKLRVLFVVFVGLYAVMGAICFFTSGCNYGKIPSVETTEDYRFYTLKVKRQQMLIVKLEAKHEQDWDFIKSSEDYDVIAVDKLFEYRGSGRWGIKFDLVKVYLQPKRSFLLNWTYLTRKGDKNTLYTKIELTP